MLTVNSANTYSRVRLTGNINRTSMRDNWSLNPQCWSKINQFASVPPSCQTGNAYVLAMKSGVISAWRLSPLLGTGAVNATLKAQGVLVGLVLAGGDVVSATSHIVGMKQTSADLAGVGHVHNALIKGQTELEATIVIGFQPSAYDIVQAVWNAQPSDYDNPNTMGELQNDGALEATLQLVKARTDNLPIDPADESDLIAAIAAVGADTTAIKADVELIRKLEAGRWKIDVSANTMTFYDPVDDITPVLVFNLLDANGNPPIWSTLTAPFERTP